MKLLKGNIIQTKELGQLESLEHACILLQEDGTIAEIRKEPPEGFSGEVIDYGDRLILQSFVDMHLHAPQYPMLGMGMDLPLLEWLQTYTFPTEARFSDKEYARSVYRKLAEDLIANGTTRVCMFGTMHTDSTLVLMEELERAGVTGYVGKVNMDRNGGEDLQETTFGSEQETLRFLEKASEFRYVHPILTPRFTPSCTDDLMAWLGQVGQETGLYVQSHLSESKAEIEWVHGLHPECRQYWETYDKYGLWKDHTVMAHCVHSDERERAAIKKAGVVVAHCADSNISLCSGICPVREMLEEGIWVTLGSDIAGGSALPIYRAITTSIQASKVRYFQEETAPAFLTVPEGYYLGTTAGHRYFGAGAGFAAGDKLHAIVVDESSFAEPTRTLTLSERLERALYQMSSENICAVWSEGRNILKQP